MTETQNIDGFISRLADKEAIKDLVHLYCRGIDRCDKSTLGEVFFPDALMEYGIFNGVAKDFIDWVVPFIRQQESSFHSVGTVNIRLNGDTAHGEVYVIAVMYAHGAIDLSKGGYTCGGRYIDRYERRDGLWKIAKRRFVLDWKRMDPTAALYSDGDFAPTGLSKDLTSAARASRGDPVFDPEW